MTQYAMTPAQIPEVRKVLVGTEHPPHTAPQELPVCLAELPTGDGDPHGIRPVRPADGDSPGTALRQPNSPVHAIAVERERGETAPAVGLGGETGAVTQVDGKGGGGHGDGGVTVLRSCRWVF
jgi:hypothetical protein